MTRPATLLGLLAAAALALPTAATAQYEHHEFDVAGDGIHPLKIWCTSSLMTQCISFFDWHFHYDQFVNPPHETEAGFSATVDMTYSQPFHYLDIWVPTITPTGPSYGLNWEDFADGITTASDQSNSGGPAIRVTTLNDPLAIRWGSDGCVTREGSGWDLPQCYAVVPEPGTWVLLATGLLGIAVIAWRRGLV